VSVYLSEMKMNNFSTVKQILFFLALASVQFFPLSSPAQTAAAAGANVVGAGNEELSRFDLDFKGGSPQQLIASIESAGIIVNVIIPTGANVGVVIPPLKMRNVTVPQIFQALEVASQNSISVNSQRFPGTGNPYRMDPRMLERYFGIKVNTNGPAGGGAGIFGSIMKLLQNPNLSADEIKERADGT
jgi:hypothetical protein